MDDATIVRTLAEFEGIVDPRHDKWFGSQAFYAVNMTPLKVPDYLTDYNAIPMIALKLDPTARGVYQEQLQRELQMLVVHPTASAFHVWRATPRQHALALATAIAKHKENGNE